MKDKVRDDLWLGELHGFPTILHARASLPFDISPVSFQKALVGALALLREASIFREISIADREGYERGSVSFKIGIGNGEGFDILDAKEEERVLDRIENRGAFYTLDLAFHIHYRIDDGQRHKVHEDHYLTRLVFDPGRVEMLVHHLKGVRRVEPVELLRLILDQLNTMLSRQRFPELDLEVINST